MTAIQVSQSVTQTRRTQRFPWLSRLLYALIGLFVVAVFAFNIFQPIKVLPRIGLAPGFGFTNQDGERRTSEDYRGKLTLYNFTYSRCTTGCPQTSAQMQSLRHALAERPAQNTAESTAQPTPSFALVTISIDPGHDTPQVLKDYAAPFQADVASPISWDFLSGDITRTKYVVGGGFGVYYAANRNAPGQPAFKLDPRFVLVDGWGITRAEYYTDQLDIAAVLQDIGYLETEIRNSQGAGRFAYEAAHLFRCYP